MYLSSRVLVLSRRPARLQEEVPVELPYPRDQILTREAPAFLHARRQIFSRIRGEELRLNDVADRTVRA